MKAKASAVIVSLRPLLSFARERLGFCSISVLPTNCSTICPTEAEENSAEPSGRLEDVPYVGPTEVLQQWDCSSSDRVSTNSSTKCSTKCHNEVEGYSAEPSGQEDVPDVGPTEVLQQWGCSSNDKVSTNSPTKCSTKCHNEIEEYSAEPSGQEDVPDVGPTEVLQQWGCSSNDKVSTNSPTKCSTKCPTETEENSAEPSGQEVGPTEVLQQWGCSSEEISKLIARRPSLVRANPAHLESKLTILSRIGITGPDLVKVINCRPRFLACRINHHLDERLDFFTSLFGSKEMVRKAVIRNPSFLTYDFHHKIKPVIEHYGNLGVSGNNLVSMLLSRPTMIPRSSFEEEKMDYIRRTAVSPTSKMYKYVVTLIGISRLETIREKVTNFERFGFTEDEVLILFGRSPLLLTLSVDKIQRNMTFLLGTMKVPAKAVVQYPFLLYCNLEAVLKPRMALAGKIQDMGLKPEVKDPNIFRAFRMTEKRFLKFFVRCHPKDVADELMVLYNDVKCVKRLAESSKKYIHKGFPF